MNRKPSMLDKPTRRDVLKTGALAAGASLASRPAFALAPSSAAPQAGAPQQMQCESLIDPLGLQNLKPRLSWACNDPRKGAAQTAFQVVVSSTPDGSPDLWDSGRIASADFAIEYGGKRLEAHQQAFWRVRTWTSETTPSPWSAVAHWSAGPSEEKDWAGSKWIGRDDLLENTQQHMPGDAAKIPEPPFLPAPYLRKEFEAHGPVRSAFLYACGLGYAELSLNGQKLGDRTERDPGFTNFDKRVLYVTHDVTSLIHPKKNALGAILGTGWYDVHDVATWHFNTAPWRQRPRLRLTLVVHYADGTTGFVTSDDTWQCSTGPILRDGIYTGEIYDARLEMPGWNQAGFDAGKWTPALLVEPPNGRLVPMTCPPIRIFETITPVAITEPKPGVFLVDMGRNFSGHAQLRVKGPAGHAITMRYAEVLHPDGTLDPAPIDRFMEKTTPRQPFQEDTYLCKGTGDTEVWEQRFSYSGFQYVEVTNFPGTPTLDNFRGRFAATDLASAGDFSCSNEIANQIQRATRASYLSNAQSYPTDCPQREKNGWTGDAGLAVEAGLTNFQSAAFYAKWLEDFADSQRPDGGFPVIIPNGGWGNGGGWPGELTPPWDAAYPIILWNTYRYTGDRRLLVRHAEPLRRYVDFFLRHRRQDGLTPGLGLGDWLPWKTETPLDYISNAYLYLDVDILTKVLSAIGQAEPAQRYRSAAQEVFAGFHKKYYDPASHRYANGSQTAQSTALYFGLVPASERAAVFAVMAEDAERLGHIDAGIIGAKNLLRALSEGGRTDLAFRIATQPEMPGWGFWMKQGATTLWETWTPGSSSNHIMFGDVSAWFQQWIAGIQQEPASVGFEKILFRPNPVGGLTHAGASYLSPRGKVESQWKVDGKRMHLAAEVPCGASARLLLPEGARIRNPGSKRGNSTAITETSMPSGRYEFEIALA